MWQCTLVTIPSGATPATPLWLDMAVPYRLDALRSAFIEEEKCELYHFSNMSQKSINIQNAVGNERTQQKAFSSHRGQLNSAFPTEICRQLSKTVTLLP